ncbi:aminopeptidase [Candidatus Aerophobetes bacterium]|nr:aminopeptidase [Candidatus Aerophobetes bacterium]
MKSFTTLIKGARLVVEECMRIEPGSTVLIISDFTHLPEAQALSGACWAVGASPVIADVTCQVIAASVSMKAPMEPPSNLRAAMLNSDVILITAVMEWANRFAHVDPVRQSCERGAKIASVEEGMDRWDLTPDDIQATLKRTEKIINAMQGAKNVHISSPSGADVTLCLEGRPALKVVPVKGKGDMMGPVPLWGEVAYAPLETKTEGKIVFDGIMLGVGVPGSLRNPIELTVKAGRAVQIQGGEEAERLKKVVDESDENADIIGEFALGTSEKESYGSPSEKGMLGTAHFALGDNSHCYPGGQNVSKLHLDGSLRDITVRVDGKIIMDKGKLLA